MAPRPRAMRETDGPDRDRQHLCDLRVVEVEEIAQHYRGPLVLGKQLQGRVDVETGADHLLRIQSAIRRNGALMILVRRGPWPPALSAQLVQRGVGGNPVRPGRKGAPAVEAGESADDRDHGLLGRVLRVVIIAEHSAAKAVQPVLVASEQSLEGFPVALSRCGYEHGVRACGIERRDTCDSQRYRAIRMRSGRSGGTGRRPPASKHSADQRRKGGFEGG